MMRQPAALICLGLFLSGLNTAALANSNSPPDCIPRIALDAYVQRSIERKADIYASITPLPGATLFLGSSIIEEGPWAQLFKDRPVLNWGISAETTDDLLERLTTVIDAEPAEIILYIGGNDLSRLNRTPEEAAGNVETIIARLTEALPGTQIYLSTLFPREATHARSIIVLNDELRALAKTTPVTLIDSYPLLLGENGTMNTRFSNDSIHLSGAAYHLWADEIAEALGS